MNALEVDREDAVKIVKHFKKQGCLDWIDDYDADSRDEPLTDVHYEDSFEDMVDWQYEDCKPSEMFGVSANIKEHPCMLELSDVVIFWYGLVD